MITTAIIFDHHGRAKKNEPGSIEIRVIVDRKPYYINTGVRVLACEFRASTIVNRPDSEELNERILIISKRVEQEINACLDASKPIDIAAIRRTILQVNSDAEEHRTAFLDWIEEMIGKLDLSEGTRKHYTTLHTRLQEYGKIKKWHELTTENIIDFDAWLRTLNGQRCKVEFAKGQKIKTYEKISSAGVYNYHKCLKRLLNDAVLVKKIQINPYDQLKGKFKRGEKENIEYLTEDEMQAIMNVKLDGILSLARDIFVFQMFTGMAYADAMNFDISSYKKENGKWISRNQRIKTGVAFINQLLPPVVAVLEKYDMQLPYIDAADYNHALKLIGEACNITTHMHSHLARHTFATYMLRNGAKIENVQKMLGHASIVTTQKYAKVLAQSVHDDFDMIADKLK